MITDDDLAAYLHRLGLQREPASVDALFRLHRAQLERVPYETTWMFMNQARGVDRSASLHHVVHQQTGGYCYQLNGALSLLLAGLGYDVTLHVGGVHGPDGPTLEAMENHLVLLVHGLPTDDNPGGEWYVDAGLGDALHDPLPLMTGTYQQGPFQFGLEHIDSPIGDWVFTHHSLGSFPGMVFRSTPATMDDFASRNLFLSTSPESSFAKIVTAQRRDAGGIDVLRGKTLRRVESSVTSERTLDGRDEWFQALGDVFRLPLQHATAIERDTMWTRVQAAHEAWLTQS